MPPLIIDESEIAEALKRLRRALDSVREDLKP
jgi:acetylornithine/succinyldiaminopimelate/putrescine aminotransferase